MSDDIETEKPKRKYTRRTSIFGNAAADTMADADDIAEEGEIEAEVVPVKEEPAKVLGAEPVSNTLAAKITRKLGLCKSMELKPWKGLDRWVCTKCKWETFDEKRARRHAC